MAARFVIKRSGEQFTFSLQAANSETILASERYTGKVGAVNGVQAVKTNAPIDGRYERRVSAQKQPYFVLKAANHEIVGTSQMYSSDAARDAGIASVKASAPYADVIDQAS
jgi:uncharacterized protein YegP (UPF0339 family)